MKKNKDKIKKSKMTKIMFLFAFLILMMGIGIVTLTTKITTIEVVGNTRYTNEEIINKLLPEETDRLSLVYFVKSLIKKEQEIPFIETYSVEMISTSHIKIKVYEKTVVGYVEYMGAKMYFDKDGLVVETTIEKIDKIPLVNGLKYDYIILHKKIPIQNEEAFNIILNLANMIKKYKLEVDRINIAENLEVNLYIKEIKVELGNDDMINEKMVSLKDMYPNITQFGKKGTLDMTNYSEDGKYIFRT